MVRLQDFSINGLEESGHSPLTVKHVHQGGEEVLKEVFCFLKWSLVKEGGGGTWHYGILEGEGVLGRSLFLATKGRARLGVFNFL